MTDDRVGERIQDNRNTRMVAGLMLAPLCGAFGSPTIVFFVSSVIDFINRGFDWRAFAIMTSSGAFTLIFLIYAVVFGIPITIVIGTPAYLVLKKLGANGFAVYLVGGAIIAIIGAMSAAALTGWGMGLFVSGFILLIASSGGIGGLTFWLIRRPDRDAKLAHHRHHDAEPNSRSNHQHHDPHRHEFLGVLFRQH